MNIYALVRNDVVVNCIVASSLSEVNEAFPKHVAVEMTVDTTPAYIGGQWDGTRFYPPRPGPDWTWDTESGEWVALLPDTVLVEIGSV